MSLRRGDAVPPFVVVNHVTGCPVSYVDDVWQRRSLVLVVLDAEGSSPQVCLEALVAQPELIAEGVALIVTTERVPEVPAPLIVIADQWGEIHALERLEPQAQAPAAVAANAVEWLTYVQHICPECQGETR